MVNGFVKSYGAYFQLQPKYFALIALIAVIALAGCQDGQLAVAPTTQALPEAAAAASQEPTGSPNTPVGDSVFIPLVSDNTPSQLPAATPTPLLSPTAAATAAYPPYAGPSLNQNSIGVQVYLHRVDVASLFEQLRELGVGWVKVQVSWKLYQPAQDQYSEERFAELDALVQTAQSHNIKVLLGVAKAPEWSRPTTELDGPPGDNDLYRHFMQTLGQRYAGRVAAYELWNEPNLQREWNGVPLDAAALVALIRAGAEGVRSADPTALIISGAPAVTGINDGVVAIDDRVYFRAMLSAGIAQIVDGFGVHPYGWANPPDATAANPDTAVPTHNNHPSFFFQDTLQDYGALLDEFSLAGKQLWVTEFGWGSFEGLGNTPPAGAEFMAYVSEWQQAQYTQRALALVHDWPWVGPLLLWNLNFAPWIGPAFSESGYSLLRPDGSARPAYLALAAIPKQ